MKKISMKKIVSLWMGILLLAGSVSGCTGSGKEGGFAHSLSGPEGGSQEHSENPNQRNTENNSDGENLAMGRYVEKEMAIPEGTQKDCLISFFRGAGGELELYTAETGSEGHWENARRFLWQEERWQEDAGWWERVKPKDSEVEIRQVFYGLDGNYYIGVISTENDYVFHLYQIGEDGRGTKGERVELIPEAFVPEPGKTYGLIPPKIEVGADGRILVHGFGEAVCYRQDGERLFAMEKAWSAMAEFSTGYLTAEEFVTRTEDGVTRYRMEDGKKIETVPGVFEMSSSQEDNLFLFGDGKGGIYSADRNGLAHVSKGGSLWELIIDGGLSTLGMQNVYLREFLAGEEEDYYGAFSKNGGKGYFLFRYVYDAQMSAAPPQRLTVYGLEDNATVRQAAALFQQVHPEVRVEVLYGADANGNVSEDTIRALNTELLGGKGADVLILDGLPVKSYQEKGILLDIREVFAGMQTENPMMEQVLQNFTEKDGGIYSMPVRIAIPVVMGESSSIQALGSLDAMSSYQGKAPLLAVGNYENLLRQVANLQYSELFGDQRRELQEELLAKYLRTVKTIGEENGARILFTEEEMERFGTSNYVTATGILNTETSYDQGRSDCGITEMKGLESAMIPEAVRKKHPEAKLAVVNQLYFPRIMVGVNQATAQPELAKELVSMMFSKEVQQEEFFDGFPVNLAAQKIICGRDKENYSVGMGYGDYQISASWPKQQEREEIYGLLEGISVPVLMDEQIMDMIVEGAGNYLEGKESLEQAVAAIRSRIGLYQAEQQ